jgi:hypothetical protein
VTGFVGRIVAALRPATVVATGAFAVHELSYLAGYGETSHALDGGHGYLTGLLPVLAVLIALTLMGVIERGVSGAGATARRSPAGRVLTYTGAILAVFAVQEIAEAVLVAGHPGPVGLFTSPSGLVAVPLALAFGSFAWIVVRVLEAVEARIAVRFEPAARRRALRRGLRPRPLDVALAPTALTGGAAARAPPSI